jgi:hypothetical protein
MPKNHYSTNPDIFIEPLLDNLNHLFKCKRRFNTRLGELTSSAGGRGGGNRGSLERINLVETKNDLIDLVNKPPFNKRQKKLLDRVVFMKCDQRTTEIFDNNNNHVQNRLDVFMEEFNINDLNPSPVEKDLNNKEDNETIFDTNAVYIKGYEIQRASEIV